MLSQHVWCMTDTCREHPSLMLSHLSPAADWMIYYSNVCWRLRDRTHFWVLLCWISILKLILKIASIFTRMLAHSGWKQVYYECHTNNYHWVSNHCLTCWAVTFCPTYGDRKAAIKDFQVGFFTLSSWFSHASMMCHPNSSSDSSLLRVDDFNPNLRPSLRYLLTVRSDSCSRTLSRSSLAKR